MRNLITVFITTVALLFAGAAQADLDKTIPASGNTVSADIDAIRANFEYIYDLLDNISPSFDPADYSAFTLPEAEGLAFLATDNSTTVVGADYGSATTTGADNSYYGYSAGLNNTTGTGNTMIGAKVNFASSGAWAGNVAIGQGISIAGASNKLFIDNGLGGYSSPLIEGTFHATPASRIFKLRSQFLIDDGSGNTKFSILPATGNTRIYGTAQVDGAATIGGTLGVTGNLAVGSNKWGVTAATGLVSGFGDIVLYTGSWSEKFRAAAATGNITTAGTIAATGTVSAADPTADQHAVTKTYLESQIGEGAFSPTEYIGNQTIAFPNGLKIKMGQRNDNSNPVDVTFLEAFPTALISVTTTVETDGASAYCTIKSESKSGFSCDLNNQGNTRITHWMAIGY